MTTNNNKTTYNDTTCREIYTTIKNTYGIYTKEDEKEFEKKYPEIYYKKIAIWKR